MFDNFHVYLLFLVHLLCMYDLLVFLPGFCAYDMVDYRDTPFERLSNSETHKMAATEAYGGHLKMKFLLLFMHPTVLKSVAFKVRIN